MSRSQRWPGQWPEDAECLIDAVTVAGALDRQGERLNERLANCRELTLLVLMNGGIYPALELARRLDRPFRLDHVHATRYREALSGGAIHWGRWPERVSGSILLIDDIFDEGHTMMAVRDRLLSEGAEQVITAALTVKQHDRGLARDAVDDAALEVPDRYVFGCGMDWKGLWRQLDAIWAIGEDSA